MALEVYIDPQFWTQSQTDHEKTYPKPNMHESIFLRSRPDPKGIWGELGLTLGYPQVCKHTILCL